MFDRSGYLSLLAYCTFVHTIKQDISKKRETGSCMLCRVHKVPCRNIFLGTTHTHTHAGEEGVIYSN